MLNQFRTCPACRHRRLIDRTLDAEDRSRVESPFLLFPAFVNAEHGMSAFVPGTHTRGLVDRPRPVCITVRLPVPPFAQAAPFTSWDHGSPREAVHILKRRKATQRGSLDIKCPATCPLTKRGGLPTMRAGSDFISASCRKTEYCSGRRGGQTEWC